MMRLRQQAGGIYRRRVNRAALSRLSRPLECEAEAIARMINLAQMPVTPRSISCICLTA